MFDFEKKLVLTNNSINKKECIKLRSFLFFYIAF